MKRLLGRPQLEALIRMVENDVDALGWDKPARLYGIEGSLDDPHLVLAAEVTGYPYDTLNEMADRGLRLPGHALGLTLVTEGWEWAPPEELMKEAHNQLRKMGVPEENHGTMLQRFIQTVRDQYDSIHDMPDAKEVRVVICMLRAGQTITARRVRGAEIEFMPDNATLKGRVTAALRRLI